MPYITSSQIYAEIPQPKVNDALDDDGDGRPDAGILDQIIADAGNEVDGYLQARYPVPFNPAPAIVVQATLIFACEKIYGRREVVNQKNPYTERAAIFRGKVGQPGTLTKIANRELPLDSSELESVVPGAIIAEEAPLNASFR